MPFYRDHIYPHLVRRLGDPPPIREIRERIVALAEGRVLEIGVGPGVNFVHYDPARVTKVYALEPNPGMIRLARAPLIGFLYCGQTEWVCAPQIAQKVHLCSGN